MKTLALFLALLCLPVPAWAAPAPAPAGANATDPVRGEWAALSPDGQRIAYSVRAGDTLSVVVAAVAAPTQVLSRVVVGSAIGTYPLPPYVVTVAPQIQWLRWVSAERIVIATNGQQRVGASLPAMDTNPRVLPGAPGTGFINWPGTTLAHGFVIAFNADGSHAGSLMTPAQAGGSVDVIGLDPAAPHWLVLSADGADRAVNVMTGATRRVGKPTVAAARQAEANRRAACATVEGPVLAKLTQALPGSHLAVVDSDATCNRLVAVPRGGDGAVYVYDRSAQRVLAFVGAHD